ncbi:MAG: rRNA maturation RNase YbeY [Candidatus Omnitrophica bacterium]|nr:rRNA maturation RNase YbeY [Candidatus Omnitrophota bacterium]
MKKEIEIEIFQKQKKVKVNEDYIKMMVDEIKKYILPPPKKVSIYLVNNKKIKDLNRKFLNVNSYTDILAFKYSKNYGELIISVDECKKNSQIYRNNLENEILYVIIHGLLHLKGYTDYTEKEREKMFLKQDEIFEKIIREK